MGITHRNVREATKGGRSACLLVINRDAQGCPREANQCSRRAPFTCTAWVLVSGMTATSAGRLARQQRNATREAATLFPLLHAFLRVFSGESRGILRSSLSHGIPRASLSVTWRLATHWSTHEHLWHVTAECATIGDSLAPSCLRYCTHHSSITPCVLLQSMSMLLP